MLATLLLIVSNSCLQAQLCIEKNLLISTPSACPNCQQLIEVLVMKQNKDEEMPDAEPSTNDNAPANNEPHSNELMSLHLPQSKKTHSGAYHHD